MKKPTLCCECKRKRVLSGMANAKAKGKRIGRVKKRNSMLIRSLAEAKLSYREIARIAKCSHGSVHAEIVALKKEKEAAEKINREKMITDSSVSSFDSTNATMKEMNLPQETISIVQARMEENAKVSVQNIQGQYYETVD